MKRIFATVIATLLLACGSFASDIYVSTSGDDAASGSKECPLRTLEQALKQAREWRRLSLKEAENGINIYMEGGTYTLNRPIFIRPEDSGTEQSPTIISSISSYDDDTRVVISGGLAVSGWHRGTIDKRVSKSLRGKIWWADAPVRANRYVECRQMWVNGRKAMRASQFADGVMQRMAGFSVADKSITIPTPENIEQLKSASQLEMMVHQRWAIAILRVKELAPSGSETVVRFHEPESSLEFAHPWPQPVIGEERGNSSFCLMNALELVDEPGEWYQDYPSGRIYYYPREGEDMNSAEAIVPAMETLLQIAGSDSRPVHHIQIKDISFEHAAWTAPSAEGHVTLQGGFPLIDAYKLLVPGLPEKAELENQAWVKRPVSALTVSRANNIIFDGCTFSHLGSTGIDLRERVSHSAIKNSRLTDIGGTAILVGTFPDGGFETHIPYTPQSDDEICSHITIDNNLISDASNEDWGAVGIAAGYVRNTEITHNEVCRLNYSGICVGWGWTPRKSGMQQNAINYNYVHHFARQLYDVGGLYTLSNQPGSTMIGNRIEELIDAPYATNNRAFYIYFDEATDGYTVENNWCPEERFDSNRPGPDNHWGVNGPAVSEEIKLGAGLRK